MAIDFRVRDFFHPVAIARLRRLLERTQWLGPDELRAYQEERLTAIISQAYRHVPYYRGVMVESGLTPPDIKHVADLRKLPRLSKDVLRREGPAFLADNAARYGPIPCTTSGTSGSPLRFYLDRGANILEFVYYWRHWSWAGYRLGDRFAELGSQYFLARNSLGEGRLPICRNVPSSIEYSIISSTAFDPSHPPT